MLHAFASPRTLNIRVVKDLFISFCADVARFFFFFSFFLKFFIAHVYSYTVSESVGYSMFHFFILAQSSSARKCAHFCATFNHRVSKQMKNRRKLYCTTFLVFLVFLVEVMAAKL